jgi:hypothetical protein
LTHLSPFCCLFLPQYKRLHELLLQKLATKANIEQERHQAMLQERKMAFSAANKVADDLQRLRTALDANEDHPKVAASLRAAIEALQTGQPIDPSYAVLPRGGSVITYSDKIVEIFNRLPGVSAAGLTVHSFLSLFIFYPSIRSPPPSSWLP